MHLADPRITTVTDVAITCGYSNLSQFSTAFRREFGIPPKDALHHREDACIVSLKRVANE
ncbi:MAG TPA: helix-turn-helix domain-containing protein [Steroidobacteraceae bacterium]|jgi:AraC-like DNA-binding protein|nr:helix-turn-helix domain-containing protein [Steroidobacteraceae bacterium]